MARWRRVWQELKKGNKTSNVVHSRGIALDVEEKLLIFLESWNPQREELEPSCRHLEQLSVKVLGSSNRINQINLSIRVC